ncbi:hypothetical protein Tco_0945416 [Tanacetum coccineum]
MIKNLQSNHEGHECELDFLDASGITEAFSRSLCLSFAHNLPKLIFSRHLQEFYASYKFDRDNYTLNFKMYGHNYAWSLEKLVTVLNVSSQGRLFYFDGTNTNEFDKYNRYHPNDVNYIDATLGFRKPLGMKPKRKLVQMKCLERKRKRN